MSTSADSGLESAENILTLPPLPLLFPRFIEHKLVQRTLCYYRNERILDEHGQRYDTPTFAEFCVSIFACNLLCLTDSLLDTYIADCVAFAEDVLCTKDGEPLAVKFRGTKRETRWILSAQGWSFPVEENGKTVMHVHADELMLSTMRTFFEHCGVGTLNSCGSVGQALMRRAWKEAYGASWKEHRHERPSALCCAELRAHLIGARSDLFIDKSEHIPHVRELDLKNAHAAASMWLPTGKNYRFLAGSKPEDYYLAYFAECQITIHQPLAIGPFPMRDEKTGLILFPTQPGDYSSVWLWSNEIDQTRGAACTVRTGNGHGWIEMTEDMAHWVELVSWLRDTAPTKPVEFFVKKAIVAGIGRFYMPEIKYVLSEEWGEGAYEVIYEGLASTWWAVPQRDDKPYDMPHWFLWILSTVRCMLYQEMLTRHQAGARVVASNTDAFYEDESIGEAPCYPCREEVKTGGWRVKSHRTIPGKPTFPEKRHQNLVGAEKHPGKRKA